MVCGRDGACDPEAPGTDCLGDEDREGDVAAVCCFGSDISVAEATWSEKGERRTSW